LLLFGAALFPIYTYPDHSEPPARLQSFLRVVLVSAALAALLSGILWLLLTAAEMTGELSGATDRDAIASVLGETDFGRVWLARLILAIAIVGALAIRAIARAQPAARLFALLSAALLASLAGVGHTQAHEGLARIIHMGADGAHLLAAGAWLGGLVPLGCLVATPVRQSPSDLYAAATNATLRFSGMGQLAVAALIGSGLVNGWYLVGSFDLTTTLYGWLLLVKMCLFGGMLVFAALNRFWLSPALIRKRSSERAALLALRRHIFAEQILGLLIIVIVSVMGMSEPAIGQLSH
jgi:putative copper resistance protein D